MSVRKGCMQLAIFAVSITLSIQTIVTHASAADASKLTANMAQAYDQIIASRHFSTSTYDYSSSDGLIYADCIDLDKNGTQELLLLTQEAQGEIDDTTRIVTVEIYGFSGNTLKKYTETKFYNELFIGTHASIALSQYNGKTYIRETNDYDYAYATDSESFYGFNGTQLSLVDYVQAEQPSVSWYLANPGIIPDLFFSNGKSVSEKQYNAILAKYNDTVLLTQNGVAAPAIANNVSQRIWALRQSLLRRAATVSDIRVLVNGAPINFDVGAKPVVLNGTTFVPMRKVLEPMGVTVLWDSELNAAVAITKINSYVMYKDPEMEDSSPGTFLCSPIFNINGQVDIRDSISPMIINNQMYVPIRELSNLFGVNIKWDGKTSSISLTGSIPSSQRLTAHDVKKIEAFDMDKAGNVIIGFGYSFVGIGSDWGYSEGKKYWLIPAETAYGESYFMAVSSDLAIEDFYEI